jgi:glycosyltransferase involved in cell wall biosynthesis
MNGKSHLNNKLTRLDATAPYLVLLPIRTLEEAQELLPLAETVANIRQGSVMLLALQTVTQGHLFSEAAGEASRLREGLVHLLAKHTGCQVQVSTRVVPEENIWDEIFMTVEQAKIELLIFAWPGIPQNKPVIGSNLDERLRRPPCDLIVFRPGPGKPPLSRSPQEIDKILLAVQPGGNEGLILRIGNALAQAADAQITMLQVTRQGASEAELRLMDPLSPALRGLEHVTRSIIVKGDVTETILREEQDYPIMIVGVPSSNTPGLWNTSNLTTLLSEASSHLIIVREVQVPEMDPTLKAKVAVLPGDRPIAVVVDKWFAENTYHSREFADLTHLVRLKEEQGLTISLGLPALNEEATVGNVIEVIKTALMDDIPLLDEIVLIDSGSLDYTQEIAREKGIPVHIHQEILPQYGSYIGKGEALWKSLYVMTGDIVAWVDTDIRNIHPRFVYGILGPLLMNPHIKYTKGFYRRPLKEGDKILAGGGGRVTELTARPFINLFFPELSGIIQPLSGEYAGRRSALERMPFFTGYGVETGLLIDLLDEFGLQAIAQVDLLKRVHHNQPLPSLSKMSFAIMQVVFSRLEKYHGLHLLNDANRTLNLIRYAARRRYFLDPTEIIEQERPPMIELPEYRQKQKLPPKNNFAYQPDSNSLERSWPNSF